ncbi:hypothetical protein [Novosphingobium aquae]|uniref:Uncharacterized protein n=1 Tax=Novosphingobium aquae TaxID=3133435 RepID=A0ABU8SC19_9SPHN
MPNEAIDEQAAGGIGNLAFYRMCSEFPFHGDVGQVRNKLMFISRVYSVARGLGGKWDQLAQAIVAKRDKLDEAIANAAREPFMCNAKAVVKAHRCLDKITCSTLTESGLPASGRASFASKYLHFHAPDAFPILDRFAVAGLRDRTPGFRAVKREAQPYEEFCERFEFYISSSGRAGDSLRHIDIELVELGRNLFTKKYREK